MFWSLRRVALSFMMTAALAAAACTTGPTEKAAAPEMTDETSSQPATATYSCADGSMITIENLGASVRILGAGDGPIDLPAAPATQRTRYGEQPYALVLEGREALFMKNGDVPLTCTR